MPELYEEHNEEQQKQLEAQIKSRRRGRGALITVAVALTAYLLGCVCFKVYDACADIDENIVNVCGLGASKSKKVYQDVVKEDNVTILGDYSIYGTSLNLSLNKMDAQNYTSLSNLRICKINYSKGHGSLYSYGSETITNKVDGGINLGDDNLDDGYYLIKSGEKIVKVACSSYRIINEFYSLPDINGIRHQIKVYCYPLNPCLIISVKSVTKLPNNYYDFVVISDSELITDQTMNLFNNYKVKFIEKNTSLKDIDSYHSNYVINLNQVSSEAEAEIVASNFVTSSSSLSLTTSTLGSSSPLEGFDSNYYIRELGGRILGGNSRSSVDHSFDLACYRGDYDQGKFVIIINAPLTSMTSKISDVIDYFKDK
ncbi:MAG: hypothetical protein HUJ61_01520 [Bacilli bacterium]|nr:hypothetical protein [Bacilli bacterium]